MPELFFDPQNARTHDRKNQSAIHKALELGTGRSMLVDSENVIIGGNGVYAEARQMGIPVRVIDSDGSELIAIRRIDLKTSDAKRKALAIADNRCSDLSVFNDDKVAALFAELEQYTDNSGFSPEEITALLPDSGNEENEETPADPDAPEIPFSEQLLEAHNYIVLFFDNDVDWLQAQSLFKIQTVRDAVEYPGFQHRGVGRVIRGADAINRILGEKP